DRRDLLRYGPRHSRGPGAAHLRSVLHHQGRRPRHRPGPVHHLRHHRRARRHDLGGASLPGPRRHVPHRASHRARRRTGASRLVTPVRVLIVDDDIALLQALPEALRLRMDAVTVDTCATAAEGLERIAANDYDAIISDIKMPGMDGLALLARVRE